MDICSNSIGTLGRNGLFQFEKVLKEVSIYTYTRHVKKYIMTCRLDTILQDISETYSIPLEVLKEKYTNESKKNKKRGRKKQVKEEYIETEEYTYGGITYLVDNNNLVYTNDMESPALIGERLVDGSVKMYVHHD